MYDVHDTENGNPLYGFNKGEIKGMLLYKLIKCASI
jgi:hypothetical protein